FTRIENAAWIERLFDLPHHIERRAVFEVHEVCLAEANAMFTGSRTAQRNRLFYDAVVDAADDLEFRFSCIGEFTVDVAVTGVALHIGMNTRLGNRLLGEGR